MKKYILGVFMVVTFLFSSQTFATDSIIQKIYQIKSYQWDKEAEIYRYISYGSAVLIGNNKIITNAHVVLDENDTPTGNYNLCISETFETVPKCKTSLKLIQYDKTADLAILEPIMNIDLGTPVQVKDRKLNLGETVKVYGYPSNGGDTITFTEGKISGFDKGHYKIDANLDSGNSGGGAFDKDGNFIGIPYAAKVGYSTLGYVIPVSTVMDFLVKKGDVTTYGRVDSKFLKYIIKMNTSLSNQKIDNPYIQFDGFQAKGFTLEDLHEKADSAISGYQLLSKTQDTTIVILSAEVYGKEYINDTTDLTKLREQYAKVIEKRDVTLGGKKIRKMIAYIGEKQDDGTIDKNVVSIGFDLGTISFFIYTDKYETEKKSINAALTLFVKNFQIKKDLPLIDKTHYNTSIGSFDIIPGMNFMKALGMTKFVFDSPIVQDGIIEVKKMESTYYDYVKIYSTTKFEDKAYYLVDDPADNVLSMESEIKQNTLGIYYLNSKIKEDNGAVKIVSQFFTKIDTSVSFIKVTFTMEKEDSELEKKYYQVLDTVALNGTFPFKSAAIGVVADASYTPRAVSLADHYAITIPSPTYVGEATDMTIKVLDASGAVVPDYIGTIYIVVDTDTGAIIPYEQDGYTFTASDSGSIIIPKGLTFSQAGTMKLTVVDIDDDTLEGTTTVVVSPKR